MAACSENETIDTDPENIDANSEKKDHTHAELIHDNESKSKQESDDNGAVEAILLQKNEEVYDSDAPKCHTSAEKVCDICSDIRQAKSFCRTCEAALCIECSSEHLVIKSTQDHTIVDIAESMKDTNKLCGICLPSRKNAKAVSHCKDCPDYLCSDCTVKHKALKPTRSHVIVNLDMEYSDENHCEICTELVDASSYCQECDQNLCKGCEEQHKRIKLTRNHFVTPISQKVSINKSEKCRNEGAERIDHESENILSLDLRIEEGKHLTANDNRAKTHEAIDNMQMRPDDDLHLMDSLCEPCLSRGKSMRGTSACKQCKEVLCQNCTTYHSSQKLFRDHTLLDIREFYRKDVRCEPCCAQGNNVPAIFHCIDCVERLCKSCKIHHTSHRMLKNHTLIPILEHLLMIYEDEIECGPCKYQGVSTVAVGYCIDCEVLEPLCTACIQQHGVQKMTRGHKCSMEISKLTTPRKPKKPPCTSDQMMNLNKDQRDVSPGSMTLAGKETEMNNSKREQSTKCSKPVADETKSDSVRLIWDNPDFINKEGFDQYQIRYRMKNDTNTEKWKSAMSESKTNTTVISGLRSDTTYEFQVRPVFDDGEGQYSIVSDPVKTRPSFASKMLDCSTLIPSSSPDKVPLYRLNTTEIQSARNKAAKTRKVVLGEDNKLYTKEKTLMLVGATGSGKSTLVDGFVNYLMGVSFDDPFRFKLVTLEEGEQNSSNQAVSQTEWITSYTIHPHTGGRHNFRINIIDTPGFGDTRGIDRDTDIVRQIKELFSADQPMGVTFIDAVCFLVKAPDARLTVTQKYIFHSIMSLFGNDISRNICTLITFADGDIPPVLSALKESNLPFGDWFLFNNSGLFVQNESLSSNSLSPIFWSMGHKSFKSVFEQIEKFETKSLKLTKEVLEQREYLQSTIDNIQPQVNEGLHKLNELRNEIDVLQKHKMDIEFNKEFEYTVDETRQIQVELEPGYHVTNCLKCNRTCHKTCRIPDDEQKARCSVMDQTGYCSVCPAKCHWSEHKNAKYVIDYIIVKVTRKYQEKLQKYEEATGKKLTHEKLIIQMIEELNHLFAEIETMMTDVTECKRILNKIALVPDPLSVPEHIDLMIQAEEIEKKPGFDVRIKMLKNMRIKAEIHKGVDEFKTDLESTKTEVQRKVIGNHSKSPRNGPQRAMRWLTKKFHF